MSKVVHLSDEAHRLAKEYCKKLGMRMSDWVGDLIRKNVAAAEQAEPTTDTAPIIETTEETTETAQVTPLVAKKKTLPALEEQEGNQGLPPYAGPPFWAKSDDIKAG